MNAINKLMSVIGKNTIVKFTFEIFGFSPYPPIVKWIMFPFVFLNVLFRRILRCNDISKMDFVITTKCSLRCKHCSNLMQYYGEDTVVAQDYNIEDINSDLDKLLNVVDRVWQLVVVGGEPFMNKDLVKILERLISSKRIKIINLITNGTIIPNEVLLTVMQNPKIQVTVSDYGKVAKNKDRVLKVLQSFRIKYRFIEAMEWVDRGEIIKRGRTVDELINLYGACISKCTTLMNGKIYNCEVYSNGVNLGYMEESKDEIIDIRNISKENFSKALKIILSRNHIHACDYCGEVAYNEKCTVTAGIQLPNIYEGGI